MKERTLRFCILRYKPGKIDPPRFQGFHLPVNEDMSVLDALEKIRLEQDSSLMYRHSCHHSSCGTCACKINGKEKLTCVTKVFALETETVTLEPLDGFRKEGDLVVNMTGFYDEIADDWTYIRKTEQVHSTALPEDVTAYTRLESCIECGSCVSACPAVHEESQFMGPAALATLHNELLKFPEKEQELLLLAGSKHGERWCERAIECSRVCPTQVSPAKHILDLRKALGKVEKIPQT
ncbi:succinate dehydrogenase and fumarate reductase iron-sulfur protein [Candidatus Vecturithrix granuli]|uniref:Fumarate reductase iron-sulfur subunit n=1 Tax=Vecturithrix granuli TaxID=1499967 RepID=A0A081BTX8_VECG1|nr:succinate dehydrogenase and fumarate reductase iron-sulfur protein [Candidatus Vecturithrix granuli]